MTLPIATELLVAPEVDGRGLATAAATTLPVPPTITPHATGLASDEQLLARFLTGDRNALGELATRHEPHLLGLACALTGRRDLALESVQETWLRVIKYGRTFRSGSTVKTWLYRILINTCKDARAKNYRRGGTGSLLPVVHETDSHDPVNSSHPDSPDLSHLRAIIDTLSGDQKLLILLCYHNGLSHPLAAEVLDIPLGTLKSRLHTILTTLRSRLMPFA